MDGPRRRLTTAEVAARLGVKPATVYAYVSRGQLRRHRGPGGSTFDPAEVDALARTTRAGRAAPATGPAITTELTLIEGGRPHYRGEDAVALAAGRRFEEVGEWLLTGSWPRRVPRWEVPADQAAAVARVLAALPGAAGTLDRVMVAVAVAAAADPLRHDRTPAAVAAVGRRVAALIASVLGAPGAGRIAASTTAVLSPLAATPARVAAVDAALVLLADHELAASTLAARTAAAFGADPYAAVGAGLAAASGAAHAGASVEVRRLLDEAARRGVPVAVGDALRRGPLPGLGMPLYPDGDPRAVALLGRIAGLRGPAGRTALVAELVELVAERGLPAPNVDLGLAALTWCLDMPADAGEALFVLARSVGWVAHTAEQYSSGGRWRVRASYTGVRPAPVG